MPRTKPTGGLLVADFDAVAQAKDADALDALPTGSRILGRYPAAPTRADMLEKDADGDWVREGVAIALTSAQFVLFPVPVLRVGMGTASTPAATPSTGDGEAWLRGDWVETFTGRQFYPMDPKPADVDVEDIAHALGMLCRFNGHVDRFYSVAEHCYLLSLAVAPEHALWALLHGATEAYVGDMVRPLKLSQPDYVAAEHRVEQAIAEAFNLGPKPPEVKEADTRILLDEKRALISRTRHEWFVDSLQPLDVTINAWPPAVATAWWMNRFTELTEEPR